MVATILIGHRQTGNGDIAIKRGNHPSQKKKAGGGGGGGGGVMDGAGVNRTAGALKWAKPTSMPSNERLRTVEVGTIYEDWRRNGLPIDLSNPNERARIDRLKTDILRSSESGEPFTAPRLSFAKPGNEFNIPPGYDITDGRHRLVAFYELGFRTIRAWVEK
jgi:hypothetical protein